MVVSFEQLEEQLQNSTRYFRINPQDDINIFVLFVKSHFNIAIMSRILQRDMQDENRFIEILNEYASLFDIMAEEDPGYR